MAKEKADDREPLSAFRFSQKANRLLTALCKKTKRNRTLMLEYLIEMGAEAEGIPVDDEPPVKPTKPKEKG